MKKYILSIAILCVASFTIAQLPKVYLVNAADVATIKKHPTTATQQNIKRLARDADKWMDRKIGSVMDKKFPTPSGNQHNYMSMAKYYWPDPSKPDGKPYIKKDGEKNPANDLVSDDKNFDDLIAAVNTLSWAYYFTDDEKYADKATKLIRFWFLDTATMMLPNLNNSQIRTGIDTGVSTGIIDSHELPKVVDAIGVLRASKSWKASDETGMQRWFTAYLDWLRTSKNGKKEAEAPNNHGTFYDAQVITIALFTGQSEVAKAKLQTGYQRMASQIQPDGKQPLELERTLALGYSTFDLEAWSWLAQAAATQGIDLWHYQTPAGGSIKKAIDYLLPYVTESKKWEYQQINPYKAQEFYRLLLLAAVNYKDDSYAKQAEKIKDQNKNVLYDLLYKQ